MPLPSPDLHLAELHPAVMASWDHAERGVGVSPPPPLPGKAWYGTPVGDTLATDNFGVVWNPGEATVEVAQLAGDALEAAWDALVATDGWQPPPGSEAYLVWVVLDPYLGVDGVTVELASPDLPMGHVVIHLDPTVATDEERFREAAAHELAHALQYRVRDWSSEPAEAWFWEASASWAVTRVLPGSEAWVADAAGFLEAPDLRYDTLGGHDRGMVLLLRWAEANWPGAVHDAWEAGRSRQDDAWSAILADVTGQPEDALWGGFAAAVGNGLVDGADLLPPVVTVGELQSGSFGDDLPRLGVHYHRLGGRAPMLATLLPDTEGALVLAVPGAVGDQVLVAPGQRLAVVGLDEVPADYQVFLAPPPETDPTDTPPPGGSVTDPYEVLTPSSCGCASGSPGGGAWLGWLAVVLATTRAPATRPCRTRSR